MKPIDEKWVSDFARQCIDEDHEDISACRPPEKCVGEKPVRVGASEGGMTDKIKLLVVDDDRYVLHMLKRLLSSSARLDPVFCLGSEEALLKIQEGSRYDVILSDVMMPTYTGPGLQSEIRKIDADQAGRFIFMSGFVHPDVAPFLIGQRLVEKTDILTYLSVIENIYQKFGRYHDQEC